MKIVKKAVALALALVMTLGLAAPVFADDELILSVYFRMEGNTAFIHRYYTVEVDGVLNRGVPGEHPHMQITNVTSTEFRTRAHHEWEGVTVEYAVVYATASVMVKLLDDSGVNGLGHAVITAGQRVEPAEAGVMDFELLLEHYRYVFRNAIGGEARALEAFEETKEAYETGWAMPAGTVWVLDEGSYALNFGMQDGSFVRIVVLSGDDADDKPPADDDDEPPVNDGEPAAAEPPVVVELPVTPIVPEQVPETDITVVVDGAPINFMIDGTLVEPVNVDGNILVPIRPIAEALGAEPHWNGGTRTVTLTRDDMVVTMTIGENFIFRNGERMDVNVGASIINDRTYLPLRAAFNAFGIPNENITWDGATQTANIVQ